MRVIAIPLLEDNYAYAIVDDARGTAAIVDPSEGAPVLDWLESEDLALDAIWCTHHHPDHVGGVEVLLKHFENAPVLGSNYDLEHKRIAHQTRGLADGEHFRWGKEEVSVIATPGHTLGAICYRVGDNLFTGDTLFLGGCGRIFEGTMPMMHASLQALAALPAHLNIYCGHEYTSANLKFALAQEPNSKAIQHRATQVEKLRASGTPTVPGSVESELATNVFLRAKSAAEFEKLRTAKDTF